MTNYYIDTSAFLKLVVAESHSEALFAHLRQANPRLIASDLLAVEAMRAARRHSASVLKATRERLSVVTTVRLSRSICDRASELDPAVTRSLDALHLTTAMEIGPQLSGVLTYDTRMAQSAEVLGLSVIAPGLSLLQHSLSPGSDLLTSVSAETLTMALVAGLAAPLETSFRVGGQLGDKRRGPSTGYQ